jgi:hypothetical protein
MKKILFFAAVMMPLIVTGQRSIDRLFEKYAGRDGFTTFTISGDLLNLAASFEDNDDDKSIRARITEVRILTQDDKDGEGVNFLDFIGRDLEVKDYEEFMSVKKSNQDMRMLVRLQGRKVTEFLLVAGGIDNAIIQVKGNMTVSDAKRLSENAKQNRGVSIFAEHK